MRPVAAMVVPGLPIPFPLTELTEFLGAVENEIALESSLHVSTIQALPCEAEFGAHLLRVAPSHHSSDSSSYISGFEQLPSPKLKSLAACLATPTEAAETPEREGMRTGSSSAVRTAGAASSTPNIRPYEALQSLQDADMAQPSAAQQRWTRVLRRMRRRRYVEQIKVRTAAWLARCSTGALRPG